MTSPTTPSTRESSVSALRRKSRVVLDDGFCNCECMQRVNKRSKLINDYLERGFFKLGSAVAEWPYLCLIIVVAVCLGLTIGLINFELVTDVFDLWTPLSSPYYDEKKFYTDVWEDRDTSLLALACRHKDGFKDILEEKYIAEYFNFHLDLMIKSPKKKYNATFENVSKEITFSFFGENWKEPKSLSAISANAKAIPAVHLDGYATEIVPLCNPWVNSPLEAQFELSCYSLDIFHCFAEGGTPFPYENYLAKTAFTSLIPENPYMNKSSFKGLSKVELGSILGPSCQMWAGNLIPSNYIYGGEERINESDSKSRLLSVRSYETLLYIDSPYNLVRKTQIAAGLCVPTTMYSIKCPDEPTKEQMDDIADFVNDWLKDFIDFMLDYLDEYEKDESHLLKPLFFTSRTSSDLLTEAFSSNLYLLAIAYILMLLFVSCTGCRPRNLFLSRGEASFGGMVIVLLSVLATMGLGAVFWKFSPNVIQVLPFVAIGLGVDDMFVMLQCFYFNKDVKPSDMVAESLRVSGPSVTLTTLANFLAFLIASFMPLPDVNRFAQFGMVMVAIHYFVMIFGFSSVLALLARRMQNGYNDFAWACCWQPFTENKNPIKSQKPVTNEPSILDPLYDFLTRDDIRIVLFVLFCVFFGAGLYGVGLIHVGLPLESIVPASYGADYLEARGGYYFSYINTLYSDGYRDQAKPIDWVNNFETWINETEQILEVDTDLVYQDKTIHSFWAWDMRDYYKRYYATYFGPYGFTATFLKPSTDPTSAKSSQCETNRIDFCNSVDADYTYNSSLYQCLWFNKAFLTPACRVYLTGITPTTTSFAIAKQVTVYSPNDESVAGLYTAPSTDTTNVYYRSDGATLYQRPDLTWAILNAKGDPKYFGLGTLKGSQPPQYGWSSLSGPLVSLTVVYYDTTYYNYGVKRDNPQETDDTVRTSFTASYAFGAASLNSNPGGCHKLEVMQQSMASIETFSMVRFDNGSEYGRLQCGATLDATTVCKAIRDGSASGSVKCGSYEYHGGNSHWWTGDCDNGDSDLYTIAASTQTLDDSVGCFCSNKEASTEKISSVQFCGEENYGGINIDTSKDQCSTTSQTLAVQCDQLPTCDSLEVCYEFIATSSSAACGGNRITIYEAEGTAGVLGSCLLQNYDSLSTCCQQAVKKNIIDTNTCDQISIWSDTDETVCALKDSCDSSCQEICYSSINSDCRAEIEKNCNEDWIDRDQAAFKTCMDDLIDENTTSLCCNTSYTSVRETYSGCLIPKASYYDYVNSRYDYSDCTAITDDAGVDCGTYDNTETQLNCMLTKIDSVPDGCCKVALQSITISYVFTKDCAGDIEKFCNRAEIVTETCKNSLLTNKNSLSPNCKTVLQTCRGDETWPDTAVGQTASRNCSTGYTGIRTRTCLTNSTSFLPYWGPIITDQCSILYCPEETVSNQLWRKTPVGNVAFWHGTEAATPSPSSCGLSSAYTHRYCGFNSSTGLPNWGKADSYCRANYPSWPTAALNRTCDATSSVVFVRPRLEGETRAQTISTCKDLCVPGLDYCEAIVYDKQEEACYAYDWCVPTTVNDKRYKLYRSPYTFGQSMSITCSVNPGVKAAGVKPSTTFNARGIPHPLCFGIFLWEYVVDPQGGAKSLDKFQFNDRNWLYINNAYRKLNITTTKSSVAVQKIENDMIGTQFIVDLRDWVDNHLNDKQLYVVLNGLLFDLDTQYIKVTRYFVTNLLLCIIAVMVAGLLFLVHPMAACVVLLVEVVMVIEVYGFVDWADLHMNGVLTLNMLVAIGLTMEFAAHIARAFMMASAKPGEKIGIPNALSGQIRMKKALREMFTPVTLTAITTFIGIAPIASASFPYFRDYYFVLYVMMILTGWINGAVFQPVILSFLNPGTFSHENDRRSTARGLSKLDTETGAQSVGAQSTGEITDSP